MIQANHYKVLGVHKQAEQTEIRAAYIRLLRQHHPDTKGYLPSRLREVQQAYRCLMSSAARTEHDQALQQAEHEFAVRQRSVQRRLRRYDQRHFKGRKAQAPSPALRLLRDRRVMLVLTASALALAQAATEFRTFTTALHNQMP